MCVTFFHLSPDPASPYKLVVAFNRDEFCARPTAGAEWRAGLLGGWDMQPGRSAEGTGSLV